MPNTVTLVGAVQDTPELRFTPSGLPVANFSVRITTKPQQGEARHEYFDVTAWRSLAEHVAESLEARDRVIVFGRLNQQRWEQDGNKRSKVVVVAEAVGPDLTYNSAAVDRTERSNAPGAAIVPSF